MPYTIGLPLRQWREVVEQACFVDVLSGGRLELGVAVGDTPLQFEIFRVSMRDRARLTEAAIPFIRTGLVEGSLPDGLNGERVPVSPRPVQESVPIYVGGLAPPAVDRAVRLGDGCLLYDYVEPESVAPRFMEEVLGPALERHGRSLDNFFFGACFIVWVTDDPDRDWATIIEPALAWRQQGYLEMARSESKMRGMTSKALRAGIIIDTPEGAAKRLMATWQRAPWNDLALWHRLPGVTHETAMEHLERVAKKLMPLLAEADAKGDTTSKENPAEWRPAHPVE
jgi:alkanesulfonate monooxygenase SsuD/methylene tetrahydromethanopterin reductase-like flavin-dependent oxidoreductase (luciferase family)